MDDQNKEEGAVPSPVVPAQVGSGVAPVPGAPLPARDWNKIVADANGSRAFLPEELKKDWDALDKVVVEYNKKAKDMARESLRLGRMRENFWMEVREALGEKGVDIWMKEVGFDADALKEDKFVINMWEDENK